MSSVFKPNTGSYIIKGSTDITADIVVGGEATISTDLTVDGTSTLGNTIVGGTLQVSQAMLSSKITIQDTSSLNIDNPQYGEGALNIAGGTYIKGSLFVEGEIIAMGDITTNFNNTGTESTTPTAPPVTVDNLDGGGANSTPTETIDGGGANSTPTETIDGGGA